MKQILLMIALLVSVPFYAVAADAQAAEGDVAAQCKKTGEDLGLMGEDLNDYVKECVDANSGEGKKGE